MKIRESKLRRIIKSVIKENYDTVPSSEGIYHSSKKHVAGNLWKLLNCYEEVKRLLSSDKYRNEYTESQLSLVLNKIVFGNYGPMKGSKYESDYAYKAGIYYGGFDWNNYDSDIDDMTEDPALNSGDAYELVEDIIYDLGLSSDLDALRKKFSGIENYNRLSRQYSQSVQTASSNPPNVPPTQAISASPSGGGGSVNQNVTIGRHCLGTYLSPFGMNEAEEFEIATGIRPMTDASKKHQTICLILFFENNKPVSYHSLTYTDTTHIKNICYNWIDNKKLPGTNIKQLDNGQAKDFVRLNNLPKSEMMFIDSGTSKRYWVISRDAKIAQAAAIKN